MGITRKSLFGFPPAPNQGSQYTQREVPLSQGMKSDTAWPVMAPGSAQSMTNFLPLDGVLQPRSRLSSINTIRSINSAIGMAPHYVLNGNARLWVSNTTCHGIMVSNGSISRASFVSSFGLGVAGINVAQMWQYAQVYSSNLDDNMLLAASSNNTIMCLYLSSGNVAQYSYLTSAPKAFAITVFDNYVVGFNTGGGQITRVQWCVRGLPSNWTGEGSGFEDLLAMRGIGTALIGTADNRIILFSNLETWYGVGATYPAQFVFEPLDNVIGCNHPKTIQDTDVGVVFLGSDAALRVLPRGGGVSQIINPTLNKAIRDASKVNGAFSWGVYNPATKVYHLFLQPEGGTQNTMRGFAINVTTGEWGYSTYGPTLWSGAALTSSPMTGVDRLFFGDSSGTVYSTNSLNNTDDGTVVASTWRSGPIAADLPGSYKQLTQIDMDYRATSTATLSIQIAQDGGNVYDNTINTVVLPTSVAGRATAQIYIGGALPSIHVASTSTGYELHRMDVSMTLGGRRSG